MKDEYIKLPIIKEVEVKGYELFKSDWKYEFKKGLNLFIGENRLGKTTTVYIILYGIVGLPKKNKNFFSDRVPYREKIKEISPTVRLKFDIGSDRIEIERDLFDSQINYLSIHGQTYIKDDTNNIEEIYSKEIISLAGMSSLDDYKFLLENLLIREEEGNYLLWVPEAQIRVLRLLFNYGKFDEEFRKLDREVRKYDTKVRGQQDTQAQFKKSLDAIKKEKYAKIRGMQGLNIQKLEKRLEVLIKDKNKLNSSDKSISENIKNIEKIKKNATQIVHGLSNEVEELDSKIIRVENKFFKSVYSDPKIQLADHKLKHYQICMFCNQKISSVRAHSIVTQIEDKKKCPVCNSKFIPYSKDKLDENERQKLVKDLVKKRKLLIGNKRELSQKQKELNDLSEKLKQLWTKKNGIEEELIEKFLEIGDIELTLSMYGTGKKEDMVAHDKGIMAFQKQIDDFQEKIDKAKVKYKEALYALEKKNCEFNQLLEKMSKALVRIFQEYAQDFFNGCELVVKQRKPKESKIKLNVFIPKFDGCERTFVSQVSKSEAIFLEYAFRMSLCELFKQITGNESLLVIETSEGAFDIGNVRILAETISRFYSNDSYLLVISNLGRTSFLRVLIENSRQDISDRVLNYLEIGRLSKEQEKDRDKFDGILKQLFKI